MEKPEALLLVNSPKIKDKTDSILSAVHAIAEEAYERGFKAGHKRGKAETEEKESKT